MNCLTLLLTVGLQLHFIQSIRIPTGHDSLMDVILLERFNENLPLFAVPQERLTSESTVQRAPTDQFMDISNEQYSVNELRETNAISSHMRSTLELTDTDELVEKNRFDASASEVVTESEDAIHKDSSMWNTDWE
ncbi:unnamed protein product [Dicrocoelium dendriticum]|nr:unnamed protein product [Dicrocoelium dendriticum]